MPNLNECNDTFDMDGLFVYSRTSITDTEMGGLMQIIFANEKLCGGRQINSAALQEQIVCSQYPELYVCRLFCEDLCEDDRIVVKGVQKFVETTGYGSRFRVVDSAVDRSCKSTTFAFMNAVNYNSDGRNQFTEQMMLTDMKKAFITFDHTLDTPAPAVSSGHWGCGAFGGVKELKFLQQLIVCRITHRPLVYHSRDDTQSADNFKMFHTYLCVNGITVSELWSFMKRYHTEGVGRTLFEFIINCHTEQRYSIFFSVTSDRE